MHVVNVDSNMNRGVEARISVTSVANAILRLIGWFGFLVVGLIFVAPQMTVMFQEFGIELSVLTQFVIAVSERMLVLWIIFLPVAAILTLGAEALLLFLPVGSNRRILNRIYWVVFLIIVGIFVFALAQPTIAISVGLAS